MVIVSNLSSHVFGFGTGHSVGGPVVVRSGFLAFLVGSSGVSDLPLTPLSLQD